MSASAQNSGQRGSPEDQPLAITNVAMILSGAAVAGLVSLAIAPAAVLVASLVAAAGAAVSATTIFASTKKGR